MHCAQNGSVFSEEDDGRVMRESCPDDNIKINEYLFRRVEFEGVVNVHLLAVKKRRPRLAFASTSSAQRRRFYRLTCMH